MKVEIPDVRELSSAVLLDNAQDNLCIVIITSLQCGKNGAVEKGGQIHGEICRKKVV